VAEGEFALVQQHLEEGMSRFEASYTRVTNTDNDLYAMLADVAAQRGDAEVIAKYAHLAEQEALAYGHILHQAGYTTGLEKSMTNHPFTCIRLWTSFDPWKRAGRSAGRILNWANLPWNAMIR
jgi:hypothetical protein